MRPLVHFLNQGILPVVGRDNLIDRLMEFWKGTLDAQGLRTTLVIGEAGTGKSCIVDEIAPRIIRSGGAVVHMKLYPESATSLAPLAAKALARTSAMSNLLKIEHADDINAVIAGLRRLSHLRPTLIIVEDMHLLSADAERDLTYLLHSISDEPVSLLSLARPLEVRLRGLLERYLVEEIELQGLNTSAIDELWHQLFDSEPDAAAVGVLHAITLGNPLALRSALRGALHDGLIEQRITDGEWRLTTTAHEFMTACDRSVRLLSLGLASHVSQEELTAAAELACLGEVFAHETASRMFDDGASLIERLMFKGIISTTHTTVTPLAGPASSAPLLAFTHSLLHRHLVEQANPDLTRLIGVVSENAPLYSILPFTLLAERPIPDGIPADVLKSAIDRALALVTVVNATSDWQLAVPAVTTAERLLQAGNGHWSTREAIILDATILHHRLKLKSGRDTGDEYRTMSQQFHVLLQPLAVDTDVAELNLHSIIHRLVASRRHDRNAITTLAAEAQDLIERFPDLRRTKSYGMLLRETAVTSRIYSLREAIRQVEAQVEALRELDDQSAYARILCMVAPFYLDFFNTEAELQQRNELVERIIRYSSKSDPEFLWHQAIFFYEQGKFRDLLPLLPLAGKDAQHRGLPGKEVQIDIMRICVQLAMGGDRSQAEQEIGRISRKSAPGHQRMIATSITTHVTIVGLLLGADEWTLSLFREFSGSSNQPEPTIQLVLALRQNPTPEKLEAECRMLAPHPLAEAIAAVLQNHAAATEQLRALLPGTFIRFDELATFTVIADALYMFTQWQQGNQTSSALLADVRAAVDNALEWLAERRLPALMRTMADRCSWCLSPRKADGWHKKIAEIEEQLRLDIDSTGRNRLQLSMLGTIEVTRPDGEIARPRGARLKTLLGIMVADRMLDSPLSNREFYTIAAGDDDIERARNTIYAAMHRLRDIVGTGAINTDGETPQLDPGRVGVDLLEAHGLLREASTAARQGSWMRAFTALRNALAIIGNEVPFPTLYDNFFEAAREDFENRLRRTIIAVGSGLLREGDATHGEEVLRLGTEAMPEDEEITELLQSALLTLGKRTEAERVKMRGTAMSAE